MTPNRSPAVMAQRHEPPDSLDFFPTPFWASRALCVHVAPEMIGTSIWECACGDGAMARPLSEYASVYASDVCDYGFGGIHDFLMPFVPRETEASDWCVTNPPFRLAEEFAIRGLVVATKGVALLVRSVFTESVGRYERLFRDRPPAIVAQFSERVPMVKGRLDPDASSATAYAWLVWKKPQRSATKFLWIPPCRKVLERDGDYRPAP